MDNSLKKYDRDIAFKIVIATIFACSAILLSLYISKHTFRRILTTVDELSQPDQKMQLVNHLFRGLARLDQLQRDESLQPGNLPYYALLKESQHFQSLLDTLRMADAQNEAQVLRIDSMQKILRKRDMLFVEYLQLHTALIKNDTLAVQVKALSDMLERKAYADSNLAKASKTTSIVIDTLRQEDKRKPLWKRIFTKRHSKPVQVKKKIEERVEVHPDTLALRKNDTLTKMGKAVSEIAVGQTKQKKVLADRQSALNHANDMLIDQLLHILNDIEKDELVNVNRQNATAYHVVDNGLEHINIVLIAFIIGTVFLLVLILADISRSNKYRSALIEAREAAEEAGMAKQRFLSNMSHELRTPLQTIIGIAEQVRGQQHPAAQSLENIYQSSLHLLQIVNEVLDYSHISSGKYTLRPVPFNMHSLLQEIWDIISVQADRKRLTLIYDVHTDKDRYYLGDPFRLKQILLNLLGNAVKFTDKGSVKLCVNESRNNGNSGFTFIVEDTGPGISLNDQQSVFNAFEQGSAEAGQGTGLGLSIVKSLVELQHGSIHVESAPDAGARFILRLSYPEATPEVVAGQSLMPLKNSFRGHVWLVDDDAFILQLCSGILHKYGIPHTSFSSPAEALSATLPDDLKIVFLDIRMSGMTGIELCRQLRQKSIKPQPLFVALTAQALPDEQEEILRQGFDKLLMKPFLEKDFIAVLTDTLDKDEAEETKQIPGLAAIRKMAGNDEALIQLTLQNFIAETKQDLEAANTYFSENNLYMLSEMLHKLAGRLGMMGMTDITVRLRTMEINLRQDKGKITASFMSELNIQITAVINTISELTKVRNAAT